MRTLNKTLCLVLALVMVLGMFGVATAADFTDDETIQYKEAVGVMTGIGSINGMGDGTFAPTGNVTRAQAAKMVAYAVLGADIAETLPVVASSFKDVDANFAWAIPSIEYLVKEGVIDGRGDGTFDPNGNITAYEIAKMLLAAAGYGKNGEFVGPSWALNVAIVAQKNGVFAGTKATDLNAAATREECALYCFTVLTKVNMVNYDKTIDAYVPVKVGDDLVTTNIGEVVYDLAYAPVVATANEGLGGKIWFMDVDGDEDYNKDKETLVYTLNADTIAATYKAGTKVSDILKEYGIKDSSTEYTVELYRNGVAKTGFDETAGSAIYANYDGENDFAVIPGGVTVDVVVPADESCDLRVLINVHYLASLKDVVKDVATTTADERALKIAIVGYGPSEAPYNYMFPMTVTADDYANFDAIYAMVKDQTATTLEANPVMVDVVPYGDSHSYVATPAIKSVALPTTVEGKVAVKGTGTLTIGDKTYPTHFFFAKAMLPALEATLGGADPATTIFATTFKYVIDATGAIAAYSAVAPVVETTDYAYAIAPTGNTSALGAEWTFAVNGEQVKYYIKTGEFAEGDVVTIADDEVEYDDDAIRYAATKVDPFEYAGTVKALSSKFFIATDGESDDDYTYAATYAVYDVSSDADVVGEAATLAEGDTVSVLTNATGEVVLVYIVDASET